jgi:hypothetical protein
MVLVSVRDVDRGPLDPNNVIGIVLEEKNTIFKVGTKVGVLDKWLAYNSFEKTDMVTYFNAGQVPKKSSKAYVCSN